MPAQRVPEPRHDQPSGAAPVPAGGALTQQLSASGYVLDVRPRLDQPARGQQPAPPRLPSTPLMLTAALPGPLASPAAALPASPPRRAAPGTPRPCVLLLSRSCDAELAAIGQLLDKAGVRWARINADELAAVRLQVDLGRGALLLNGDWLTPTVIWVRHFSARAIMGPGGRAHDIFLRDSWHAVASQLSALAGVSIQPRRPGVLEQLLLAQRHGIAIPPTVVTTDPGQACDLLRGGRLVIKAIGQHFVEADPGQLNGVFPALVERDRLAGAALPGPPVVVQEHVRHEAELRVYYVAGQVHGFEVSKDAPADLWLAPDRVGVRRADVPGTVIAATELLSTALSLRYGAFDFLLRDGEPVFLELNPDGDWRWLELKAGLSPVTMAAARMLCELHRQVRPAPPAASPGSFGLLAFLSATSGIL